MAALYTACLTVLIGVAVFVFGQIVVKFFIEPIHEQYKLMGEIAHSLVFYAKYYSAPQLTGDHPESREASTVLRDQASLLRARTNVIRWYKCFEWVKIVRKKTAIAEASSLLIGLSNSMSTQGDATVNTKRATKIATLLGIKGLQIS